VQKADEVLAKHHGAPPDHVIADLAQIAEFARRA
jgi:hypothetical protein